MLMFSLGLIIISVSVHELLLLRYHLVTRARVVSCPPLFFSDSFVMVSFSCETAMTTDDDSSPPQSDRFFCSVSPDFKEETLAGCRLLMPTVSVGNVPQLVLDLLLNSLPGRRSRIGTILHRSLVPVFGIGVFEGAESEPTTSCDVFLDDTSRVVFLQFRSPVIPSRSPSFITSLRLWIQRVGIVSVTCVASCFDHERPNPSLSPFACIATATECKGELDALNETLRSLKLDSLSLESCLPANGPSIASGEGYFDRFPGSGFLRDLFQQCQSCDLPCMVFLKFCAEGNNIPDAFQLIRYVEAHMQIIGGHSPEERVDAPYPWRPPPSWHHLFGPPAPVGLF